MAATAALSSLGLGLAAAVAGGVVVGGAVAARVQRGPAVWALVAAARRAAQAEVDLLAARVADLHRFSAGDALPAPPGVLGLPA